MLPRLVVLISGGGTNLQALIDAIQCGDLRAEIVLVVSNRREAYGLERARNAGIPALYFPLKPYTEAGKPRSEYDADLADKIAHETPDVIILAGWMHILSPAFLDHFPRQVINLHPALPGAFAGTHAISRAFKAYEAGEITTSGCMIHYVVPEVDAGEAIITSEVPFVPGDTLGTYEARLHQAEHGALVAAVKKVLGQE